MPWRRPTFQQRTPSADSAPPVAGGLVTIAPPTSTPGRALDRLDVPLLFLDGNKWTIRDAVEGTQVFGGNGSGKSTGSGQAIAGAFVRHGFGGLVLTAKPDDLQRWVEYLEAQGLDKEAVVERLVVVQPESAPVPVLKSRHGGVIQPTLCTSFSFLDYEFARTGGLTLEIVALFLDAMSPGGAAGSTTDPYWEEALRELLTHAIDLAALASRAKGVPPRLRLSEVLQIITTAPQSPAQAASSAWRNADTPGCWQAIHLVAEDLVRPQKLSREHLSDFSRTLTYWTEQFPALADKTRSIVVSSLTAKAAGLLHSPIRELLCGEDDGITSAAAPEATYRGKIVVVNLPVKLFGEVGRFAQTIIKTVWQRAVERRVTSLESDETLRPVFLWADEAQYFISRADARFQQTARSAVAATVYLTQNISNYYAALPSGSARALTDSLVGNLQTKIFHANGDPATNEWAQRLYGKTERRMSSTSISLSDRADTQGSGSAATWLPVVEAKHFTVLRTGGPLNERSVDGWVYKTGRSWRQSGATEAALGYPEVPPHILLCTFRQEDR